MPRPVKGNVNAQPAKLNFKVLGRIIKSVFQAYPVGMIFIILTILIAGASAVIPDLFIQKIIALIKDHIESGDWAAAQPTALQNIIILVVIYLIALYAFYRYITAVIRIIKGRDDERPYLSAARLIDMSFAVTEFFTLQAAMLAKFGQGGDYRTANIVTGTAVALIVAAIAVDMIVRSRKHLRS